MTEGETTTRPVGKPLKYQTVEALQEAIDAYFDKCDLGKPKQVVVRGEVVEVTEPIPYTMSGLALALDMDRRTLLNYGKKHEQYVPTIKKARDRVEAFAEQSLWSGPPAGIIFNLKNNYGWVDKTESAVEHSGAMQVTPVNYAELATIKPGGGHDTSETAGDGRSLTERIEGGEAPTDQSGDAAGESA